MPLELDDREPPEDDPDAPAPAPSVSRGQCLRRAAGESAPGAGVPADPAAGTIWVEGATGTAIAPAMPAASAPAQVCFLMRARRTVDGRVKVPETQGLQ